MKMKRNRKHFGNILVFCVISGLMFVQLLTAQDTHAQPTAEEAAAYFQNQDWENAAKAYQMITEREPANGGAWLRLGLSYHSLEQYEKAIAAYKEADKNKFALQLARFNLACANALLDRKEEAFNWLNKALLVGFGNVGMLKTDEDLASLRDDERFQVALVQTDKNNRPCEYDPRYHEFDFWVGEWDVYNPQGRQVGMNIIEKVLNGCALRENWTSVFGTSGMSLNYFDPSSGKWKQNWSDARGGIVWYEGEVKDGVMHFSGENISPDGTKALARVVLEPLENGNVHHLIEQSNDGGKTWSVYFDGTYVRKTGEQSAGEKKNQN